ncbi:LysR family transcriptional regulator [Ectothiorhodospira lacustris]|uniref:LysR family transcriptional regulator n=1 Tax=Ectothiorhodospira lacustris TaxID=2899127 RepID=UPI001EE8E939|nr:LysR family transcriptional regulator [Ectothiorhodospira lacustris]MCG5501666.1 LysR family transcriptional regulator [Ectothiorhodospira lacustris]MCG5510491.1 LysR family transcriptional regulator [Ectothiorhodospira lacustris]MCG5522237.1 LysR family transcriptional regulator [Ectothiorhodospira lacustris]
MLIDNLKAFTAVASSGSFSRAAEVLHLTQPAVSKRVAALEEELGRRLFDRIGRQVGLTEAGRVLLPQARRILLDLEETRRLLDSLSDRVEGPLVLATSHHVGLRRLPPVLKAFARQYPAVELDIRFMDSEDACRYAEQGLVDLAVVTLPEHPSPLLSCRSVWDDPLVPMVAPDHDLARGVVTAQRLNTHVAILPPAGTFTRGLVERAFLPLGIAPTRILETNYLETIQMMVGIGLGWGVLPLSMGESLQRPALEGLTMERSLGWVTHRERTRSNAATALIRLLEAQRAMS